MMLTSIRFSEFDVGERNSIDKCRNDYVKIKNINENVVATSFGSPPADSGRKTDQVKICGTFNNNATYYLLPDSSLLIVNFFVNAEGKVGRGFTAIITVGSRFG